MKQANYLDDLKRENTRVEGLYRDLMHVRSNYNFLLNNLRDIEKRTGDIRSYKKIWLIFMSIEISTASLLMSQIWIISKTQVFIVYFHQNIMKLRCIAQYSCRIPDPVIHNYLTDLDLAVVLGHLYG